VLLTAPLYPQPAGTSTARDTWRQVGTGGDDIRSGGVVACLRKISASRVACNAVSIVVSDSNARSRPRKPRRTSRAPTSSDTRSSATDRRRRLCGKA
jgi:hypothetical protein